MWLPRERGLPTRDRALLDDGRLNAHRTRSNHRGGLLEAEPNVAKDERSPALVGINRTQRIEKI